MPKSVHPVRAALAPLAPILAGVALAVIGPLAPESANASGRVEPTGPCDWSEQATHLGTDGPDVLHGTPGDDYIFPGAGDDTVYGKGGDDVICASAGNDVVYAGSGRDHVSMGGGQDEFHGGSGNDEVLVFGGTGDRTYGGPHSDQVTLTVGGDAAGLNSMVVDGADPDNPGAGNDGLSVIARHTVPGLLPVAVDARARTLRVAGTPGAGIVRSIDAHDFASFGRRHRWGFAVRFTGSVGHEQVLVSDGTLTATGGPGDDHLAGSAGDDRISGGPGNDHIVGGAGHDVADGGRGADDLAGGRGNDALDGDRGPDRIDGGPGTDHCTSALEVIACEQ